MIKKRYWIVLSLAVVSVLLASLLYNSITFAGRPEPSIIKDSVIISLKSSRVSTSTTPHINATLPFTFNPKGQNFNITRMWISFRTGGNAWHRLDFTLNEATKITLNYFVAYSDAITSFQADASFYGKITEGINILTLSEIYKDPMIPTSEPISYVELFIEYEYQA